jgi:hypothetical protein
MNQGYTLIQYGALLILSLISSRISAQEWKFVKERDGIKIYTRSDENSEVKSFKGVADFQTTMEKMSRLIGRIESFEWWDEDVSEIKVLDYKEEEYIKYYVVYDVPWPLTDRDLCVQAIITNDPLTGKRLVRATTLEGAVPEKPDKVRIKKYWQQWSMEPLGNGLVHVVLEGTVDPAGHIPTWIVNMVITDTPLNIMTKARNVVEK